MKLLVVEDSELIQKYLLDFLQLIDGIESIQIAGTLREGFDCLQLEQPDLIILDINLPDGESIELIGKFKEAARFASVAMFTNDVSQFTRVRCLRAGADWFFDKCFDFEKLMDVVRDMAAMNENEIGHVACSA